MVGEIEMKPIEFEEQNAVLAEEQDEYLSLPVHVCENDMQGRVISCWKLSWKERVKLLFTGKIWWMQLTFNTPLQPQLPMVDYPFVEKEEEKDHAKKT